MQIRPMTPADHDAVVELNRAVEHLTAPMDHARLAWMVSMCEIADVAELDGEVAGFVTVFDRHSDYDSRHYAWFRNHTPDPFWYLDRIVVDANLRRRGVASAIYTSVEERARAAGLPVYLEVNADPPNEVSLAFHRARGYRELARFRLKAELELQAFAWP